MKVNATPLFYSQLDLIGQHFNRRLFGNKLQAPLFTLRRGPGPLAHFTPSRWKDKSGEFVAEITLNPDLFSENSLLALMQSIAHQQCHLWQHAYGNPSRPGYHNAEWAMKMEDIGLMPSSDGTASGRRTGQIMFENVIDKGKFILASIELVEDKFQLPLASRCLQHDRIGNLGIPLHLRIRKTARTRLMSPIGAWFDEPEPKTFLQFRLQKRKVKYSCPTCATNVWGRPSLFLFCQRCNQCFKEVKSTSVV